MMGEYKLAKIVHERRNAMFFAYVFVDIEYFDSENTVIDSTMEKTINRRAGEVNSKTHSDWINAAIEGARQTLQYLKQKEPTNSYSVKITKVRGIEVDTTPDTIRTASAIATWRAINPAFPEPDPVFNNGWLINFH
ncbi:hypothetical protein [Roseofilum sp. Guam]|uniref:hypothetical protein n=1 Tax=Roseofilum sp. Guam TaxID=2821502 RepID=UPI001AFE327F|nr:hypothetical protein [Roseofilum sp. Guam]MBP0030062.1 hypothetical protein [Roseofilum sp. Guam]